MEERMDSGLIGVEWTSTMYAGRKEVRDAYGVYHQMGRLCFLGYFYCMLPTKSMGVTWSSVVLGVCPACFYFVLVVVFGVFLSGHTHALFRCPSFYGVFYLFVFLFVCSLPHFVTDRPLIVMCVFRVIHVLMMYNFLCLLLLFDGGLLVYLPNAKMNEGRIYLLIVFTYIDT